MNIIDYYLVVPIEDDNTFFQGHNRGVVQPEVFNLMAAICSAPNHTGELYLSHAELIKNRSLFSSKNISAVGSQFISNLPDMVKSRVAVVFCAACHAAEVAALRWGNGSKVVVVSTVEENGVISIGGENYNPVHFLDDALDQYVRGKVAEDGNEVRELKPLRSSYDVSAPVPNYGSGVTLSNDCVFSSLGFHFDVEGSVRPAEPETYMMRFSKALKRCLMS